LACWLAGAREVALINEAAPIAPAIAAPPPPLTLTPAQEKNRIIAGIATTANTNTINPVITVVMSFPVPKKVNPIM
jgi:hypothetical protein